MSCQEASIRRFRASRSGPEASRRVVSKSERPIELAFFPCRGYRRKTPCDPRNRISIFKVPTDRRSFFIVGVRGPGPKCSSKKKGPPRGSPSSYKFVVRSVESRDWRSAAWVSKDGALHIRWRPQAGGAVATWGAPTRLWVDFTFWPRVGKWGLVAHCAHASRATECRGSTSSGMGGGLGDFRRKRS
jgi:hypothetical protein